MRDEPSEDPEAQKTPAVILVATLIVLAMLVAVVMGVTVFGVEEFPTIFSN